MKKIGMRNIKTAIAVCLSIAIGNIFNMEYPFYAAIAAIICMQNSLNETFVTGTSRIVGTAIGGLIGFIFASISPGSVVLSGLGIVIIIYLFDMFNLNKSISIAAVVFCGIMLNITDMPPIIYSINRTVDTTLGIVIAFLVNYYIVPPNSIKKLLKTSKETITKSVDLVKDILIHHNYSKIDDVHSIITQLEKILTEYSNEIRVNNNDMVHIDDLKKTIKICKKICFHLELITLLDKECFLNEKNYNNLSNLYRFYEMESKDLEDNNNIVFNYHIEKILEYLYDLKKVDLNEIIQT